MGKQEELLQDLATELRQLAVWPLKWTSPKARKKAAALESIWDEIEGMGIRPGNPLYAAAEKLQLEVLSQISRVDAKRFKLFRAEFREGTISLHAKVTVAMIRLRSKSHRVFEWIDKEWFKE